MDEKLITYRDVVMVRWNAMTVPAMVRVNEVINANGKEYNNKGWLLFVIPSSLPLPDAEVRAHMSKNLQNNLNACQAMAVIIEGRGLKHAAARSIAASFVLVAGRKLHIYGSMKEALTSLSIPGTEGLLDLAIKEGVVDPTM